jgi:hypothetical protein
MVGTVSEDADGWTFQTEHEGWLDDLAWLDESFSSNALSILPAITRRRKKESTRRSLLNSGFPSSISSMALNSQ